MATVNCRPHSRRCVKRTSAPRTLVRYDFYKICDDGTEKLFASDLDERQKDVYLETVPRWSRTDERFEVRQVVYVQSSRSPHAPIESRNGRVICGPNGAENLKELQREDRELARKRNKEIAKLLKVSRSRC